MKMRRINQKLCLNLFGQKISRLSQRLLELLDLEREAPSTASSTVSSVSVSFEKFKLTGCQVAKSIFAVLFSYSTFYKNYSTFIGKSIQKFSTFVLE